MLQTAPWKGPCGKELIPSANSHMSLEGGPSAQSNLQGLQHQLTAQLQPYEKFKSQNYPTEPLSEMVQYNKCLLF